jgi:hypothetical protein
MERIENPHARIFCAQGIVGEDGGIPTFTVLCQAAAYHRIISTGSNRRRDSFCR